MNNYVTIDKKSKKEQKAYYASRRVTWNGLNPVTRTVPNGKAYKRSRAKQEERRGNIEYRDGKDVVFCFL